MIEIETVKGGTDLMLQYDLTATRLFDSCSREALPSETEMFAVTVALLLVRQAAYSDLHECDLVLTPSDVEDIATCVERQYSALSRDLGQGRQLRDRLADFIGLRISRQMVANLAEQKGRR